MGLSFSKYTYDSTTNALEVMASTALSIYRERTILTFAILKAPLGLGRRSIWLQGLLALVYAAEWFGDCLFHRRHLHVGGGVPRTGAGVGTREGDCAGYNNPKFTRRSKFPVL